MDISQLSRGCCQRIATAEENDEALFNTPHTVQILSVKPLGQGGSAERYRVIVSDGVSFIQGMLATQLNWMVNNETMPRFSIVTMSKITCSKVQDKRLMIVLGLHVVNKDVPSKLGNPTGLKMDGSGEAETPAPGAAQAASVTPNHPPPPVAQPTRPSNAPSNSRPPRQTNVYPIEGLSPYQNNWTIRARVAQKSDIRNWSNAKGEGKLFSVTLMDDTGEIKATGFNTVVDDLYDRFQEGKVYYISKARVNLAKKKFNNVQNDYELSLERNTEIEECVDTANVPTVKYNFVSLAMLQDLAKDAICDILAVVKEVGDLSEITTKYSKQLVKRELTVVDRSCFSVRLTLWGKQAEQCEIEPGTVVAFKGLKVGDFGGRTLSMNSSSTMALNPEMEEAFSLKGWYDSSGTTSAYQSHSSSAGAGQGPGFNRAQMRDLHDVKVNELGSSDKEEYFSARATIMHVKADSICYPACPTCSKKVHDGNDGWRCEKCDKSYPGPEYRYIFQMAIADWSGQIWLQGFNEVGEKVFNMSANELMKIREENEAEFNGVMTRTVGETFNFSCRAKLETYNENSRIRYTAPRLSALDFKEEAGHLRDLLCSSPWAR